MLDGADLWVYPTDGFYFIGGNLYNKVRDFVAGNITWLEGALIAANATECFAFTSSAQLTKAVLSLVQDAGLVVRCSSDPALDDDNVSIFLRMTQAPAPAPIDSLSTNQWNDVDLQGATYAARCRRQSWFMHAQIIAYCLKSISEANYRDQTVKPDAQILAAVP